MVGALRTRGTQETGESCRGEKCPGVCTGSDPVPRSKEIVRCRSDVFVSGEERREGLEG